MDGSQIGSHLRQAREAAGLTRAQAAKLLAIDESSLYRWEAGRRSPKATDRDRALAAYAEVAGRAGRPIGPAARASTTPALEAWLRRVERAMVRAGADDFEADHVGRAIEGYLADRAAAGVPAPGTPDEAEADEDLAGYLDALRGWVALRVAARRRPTVPVTTGRRLGEPVAREEAAPRRRREGPA